MAGLRALIGDIGVVATGLGAMCGLIWAAWEKFIKPKWQKFNSHLETNFAKLDLVHKEMIADGNGSMKSSINYLKKSVTRLEVGMEALNDTQRIYMNLQDFAFWESNEDGECTYASPKLCKMMGRLESEIKSENWMKWIHENDIVRVLAAREFSRQHHTAFDEIYLLQVPVDDKFRWDKVWAVAFPKAKPGPFGGKLGKMTVIERNVKI